MNKHILLFLLLLTVTSLSSCFVLNEGAKYKFTDGIYHTGGLSRHEVYVDKINDDTIAVYQVQEFEDSTAILTSQKTVYTSLQKKFKDGKVAHTFYKPSFDIDIMTIPLKYRPAVDGIPNQLTTYFNGALYAGYRTDAYKLNYKRSPTNIYKQDVKHLGYGAGVFAGIGSSLINATTLENKPNNLEYEGVTLITGITGNIAMQNLTFGLAFGVDHLLDKYHTYWIYQGQPYVGVTFGINLN